MQQFCYFIINLQICLNSSYIHIEIRCIIRQVQLFINNMNYKSIICKLDATSPRSNELSQSDTVQERNSDQTPSLLRAEKVAISDGDRETLNWGAAQIVSSQVSCTLPSLVGALYLSDVFWRQLVHCRCQEGTREGEMWAESKRGHTIRNSVLRSGVLKT